MVTCTRPDICDAFTVEPAHAVHMIDTGKMGATHAEHETNGHEIPMPGTPVEPGPAGSHTVVCDADTPCCKFAKYIATVYVYAGRTMARNVL